MGFLPSGSTKRSKEDLYIGYEMKDGHPKRFAQANVSSQLYRMQKSDSSTDGDSNMQLVAVLGQRIYQDWQ